MIVTQRLELRPLRPEDADDMMAVLADETLYAVTGGRPPDLAALRERYTRQAVGHSQDGTETWHNWILRRRDDGAAIGFVQATVVDGTAELAWLVGVAWQGRGYATEAVRAVVDQLTTGGVGTITAHIAPGHRASEIVAERVGLAVTNQIDDGERVWALDLRDAGHRADKRSGFTVSA
jgi:RimJ/RimL family protein N-acetyltransferase